MSSQKIVNTFRLKSRHQLWESSWNLVPSLKIGVFHGVQDRGVHLRLEHSLGLLPCGADFIFLGSWKCYESQMMYIPIRNIATDISNVHCKVWYNITCPSFHHLQDGKPVWEGNVLIMSTVCISASHPRTNKQTNNYDLYIDAALLVLNYAGYMLLIGETLVHREGSLCRSAIPLTNLTSTPIWKFFKCKFCW